MKLFDVYSLFDIEPVKANGSYFIDKKGDTYLDFYGGHAVISIGHTHPYYVNAITTQLNNIGFYSNAIQNPLQVELAEKLGNLSEYTDYNLFLCNSGAEANENALKLASFMNKRSKILAIKGAFHGRTSVAVAATDNPSIQAPINRAHEVTFIDLNDIQALEKELSKGEYSAVMIEGIQGVGGIHVAHDAFWRVARKCCDATNTFLIADEVQSGYGRSGKFFAHQYSGVKPDIITMAKGMGNGFPIAGIIVAPQIKAVKGMLGTTFGGSHLACSAGIAVLDVIKNENLIENASQLGEYLKTEISKIKGVTEIRGAGLMIGVETSIPQGDIRKILTHQKHIMTGFAGKYTIRLLPALNITRKECDEFIIALKEVMSNF